MFLSLLSLSLSLSCVWREEEKGKFLEALNYLRRPRSLSLSLSEEQRKERGERNRA